MLNWQRFGWQYCHCPKLEYKLALERETCYLQAIIYRHLFTAVCACVCGSDGGLHRQPKGDGQTFGNSYWALMKTEESILRQFDSLACVRSTWQTFRFLVDTFLCLFSSHFDASTLIRSLFVSAIIAKRTTLNYSHKDSIIGSHSAAHWHLNRSARGWAKGKIY